MRLIDADALVEQVGSYNPIKYTYEFGEVVTLEDINHAPTIKAISAEEHAEIVGKLCAKFAEEIKDFEPIRHGHWMSYEFATDNRWRKCSVCGTADEYINILGLEAIRRYCPFCGAKMDEEIEDDSI